MSGETGNQYPNIPLLQKACLLGTGKILRKVLDI